MLASSGQAYPPGDVASAIVARPVEAQVRETNGASVPPRTTVSRPVSVTAATPENIERPTIVYVPLVSSDSTVTVAGVPASYQVSATQAAVPVDTAGTEPFADDPDASEAPSEAPHTASEVENPEDSGVIIVTGDTGPPPGDPLESVNLATFETVQAVDKAVVAPVAKGYKKGLPEPLRDGVHNALNNLDEPVVFLNFLLQFKIGKAFETLGRFAINSTVGVAGLFDIAKQKPFHLPRRENGFGYTLGYYGVDTGPYFYLPLIGPTTLRDVFGRVIDISVLPLAAGKPFSEPVYALSKGTLSALDDRVEMDDVLSNIQDSVDPYATMREYYLTKRAAEIDVLKGKRDDADISLDDLDSYLPLNTKVKAAEDAAEQAPDPSPSPQAQESDADPTETGAEGVSDSAIEAPAQPAPQPVN